jgi:hypothetical protein
VNDIKALLDVAAGHDTTAQVSTSTADHDLLRGRRALRRQHARNLALPLGLATVFGAVLVTGDQLGSPPPSQHAVLRSPLATPPPRINPIGGVRLVAYAGQQPSGYRVAYVPEGWEIQGANPFAMTIAPVGFADQHPDSFVGKLVVMLQSRDATGTPQGDQVQVGHGTGYLSHQEGIVVLTYQDDAKHWIQLQVPPTLHWADKDVAKFGAGVEVTRDAEPGRG